MVILCDSVATEYTFKLKNQTRIQTQKQVSMVACGWHHLLFVSNSELYSMGCNGYGQCGILKLRATISTPQLLNWEHTHMVKQLACGEQHSLVLLTDGSVYAMGSNAFGQTGCLEQKEEHVLQKVDGIEHAFISAIACGSRHSVLLEEDGDLYTMGWNGHCQLGHGDIESYKIPEVVGELSNNDMIVCQISAGTWHTCVITLEKTLYIFGTLNWDGNPCISQTERHTSSEPLKISENVEFVYSKATQLCYSVRDADTHSIYVVDIGTGPHLVRKECYPLKAKPTLFGIFTK